MVYCACVSEKHTIIGRKICYEYRTEADCHTVPEAERKAREEAREKERLERQKLKNSPEYKKRRVDRDAR